LRVVFHIDAKSICFTFFVCSSSSADIAGG
jgi:hypothetical protein